MLPPGICCEHSHSIGFVFLYEILERQTTVPRRRLICGSSVDIIVGRTPTGETGRGHPKVLVDPPAMRMVHVSVFTSQFRSRIAPRLHTGYLLCAYFLYRRRGKTVRFSDICTRNGRPSTRGGQRSCVEYSSLVTLYKAMRARGNLHVTPVQIAYYLVHDCRPLIDTFGNHKKQLIAIFFRRHKIMLRSIAGSRSVCHDPVFFNVKRHNLGQRVGIYYCNAAVPAQTGAYT